MAEGSSKKRYFKKEKKKLIPKRHKAKSAAELKALEQKGLRRGVQASERQKGQKNQVLFPQIQFPNISRFITERFEQLRRRVSMFGSTSFDNFIFGSFFKASALGNFSKKYLRRARRKNFWLSIVLVASCFFACFLGWKLWDTNEKWHNLQREHAKVQHDLAVWEHVTKEYPTYRDAYFEAAVLAYRLGEKEKEGEYLQKTLSIDPNFQPALELKKLSE